MNRVFSGMHWFLLQDVQYFKEEDPSKAIPFLIGFVVIIAIIIITNKFRSGMSTSVAGKGKSKTAITPRRFNAFTLYRIASAYGLDKEQTKLLEYVFRNDAVTDPERVMNNPALLDRHFKRTYRIIERNSETDDDAQDRMSRLFSLRNVIESASTSAGNATARLSDNTPAVLTIDQESYSVKVVSSRGQQVVIEAPKNPLGTPVRIAKGTRITLSFFTKSSKGFAFDGHVVGTQDTDRGPGLQITHTGKSKPLVKRMYRRKQAIVKCDFFLVFLDESEGKKKAPKLIVDSRKLNGNILDISVGGCALRTSVPIQAGSRLKIVIDCNDNYLVNVLGQVLRSNRSRAVGTILHIKFLKVPRRAFNSISALVFDYNEG